MLGHHFWLFCHKLGSILSVSLLVCGLLRTADAQEVNPPDRGKPQRIDDSGTRGDMILFQPRDRGLPGRRDDGGTRGPATCLQGNPPVLSLLLPKTNLSLTTVPYPRFFWYVPETNAKQARFDLFRVDERSRQRTSVYSRMVNLSGQPGVMSLALPNKGNIRPLEVNQDYYWSVTILCNSQDKLPRKQVTVDGWVQRVSLSQNETALLAKSTTMERLRFYAAQGLWGDLISTLADLRACKPTDTSLAAIWRQILQSVDLGAICPKGSSEAIAPQPLLQPQCPKSN
ncbi:MAG: DUF928 domain-containing protein [Nostocaceae cyanobacterium]|nr:DUF928 domain-containing protein [Nostocaceae cyanobacterium]